ncbi:MAG: DegT/DnrJ/EryC1/StrS family aminotransferase [Nanoarchaeota archaeon]|nr:DegT/DnrJ/EryC1/StrS family aminotransferase [Nanoarchaeota archaeon]
MRINVGAIELGSDEKELLNEVIASNRISEGKFVRRFEREWADFIGTKHCIALNSGTSSLIAGLKALELKENGIKPKTKVITSPLTYIATSNAIVLSGFEPVYVDVDQTNFGIIPDNIKAYLESVDDVEKHSLILPVHLMGYACDMGAINQIAKKFGLLTFEDSAQAHGTKCDGKVCGSLSTVSDFSFYIAHNVQAGEMGALTTDDNEVARLVRKIKANGRACDCLICTRSEGTCPKINLGEEDFDPRFSHDLIGYNFKTTEFQAAIALAQLKKINWIIKKRQENVKYLNENLAEFSDLIQLPKYSNEVSYLAYPLVIKKPQVFSRKKLRLELEKKGIETRPLFGSIPTQQQSFSHLKQRYNGKLPVADYLGANGFYVGCHQYLNQDDLDYVVKSFKAVLKQR